MRTHHAIAILAVMIALGPVARAADEPKKPQPIKALLVLGGCCHDYAKQKDLITQGISARANVQWTIAYDPDKGTKHLNPIYENEDWAKGFDVIVHDECSADVKDAAIIDRVLKPHREGLPGVLLHCGMHSFRGEGYPKATKWFEFTGLASTGHGPQEPIALVFVDKEHAILKGLAEWTTGKEELYNNANGKLHDTAHALVKGQQAVKGKNGEKEVKEAIVTWVNTYNGKARVFATTLGHNNSTVEDARYLDMITRGLLWSVDKLNEEYLKPAEKVLIDPEHQKKLDAAANAAAADADKPKLAPGTDLLVPINLGRGKEATASSAETDKSNFAKNAFDGDYSTRWCAAGGSVPQWLQVDLGKPQDIVGARIVWEKDADYDYVIEGSADGKAWSMLSDQSNNDKREQVQTVQFHGVDIRHVRLTVKGAGPGNTWASAREFEIHGKEMVKAAALPPVKGSSDKPGVAESPSEVKILSEIKAPANFKVTLFASPPQVNYPTCVAAAPTGEVFVGVDPQGSLGKEKGQGKVVRCIDTDGDGKADQFTTFAKIDHPRGVHYDLDGTLYVLHPPFLSAYRDENGDGVSDKSEVLVSGIANEQLQAQRGADHTTNGFRLGIDGWLYIAMGDFGAIKAVGKDGTELQMYGGGVVRVRTDGSGLEMYSFGQRNIYDVAVDPYLNCFTRDNTNDGGGWDVRLSHVVPTGNYGYPRLFKNSPAEIVQPLADYGGGSPCGALFISEPAVPGILGASLYTVEWGANAIMRHPLVPNGASFTAQQESWLKLPRPTDMDVDTRGRIFVTSWAGGSFNYSGPNVGYMIQLVANNAAPVEFPDLKKLTDEQLAQQMDSGSAVLRLYAQREILRRGDKPVLAGSLEKYAASAAPLPRRIAAIFTLRQLQGPKSTAFLTRLTDNKDIREFVLRALADRRGDTSVDPAPFVTAIKDPDPRVRVQAAWGLGRLGKPQTAAALLPLVADADPIVSHVAINSLVQLRAADAALAALNGSTPNLVNGAVRVLQALHDDKVVDGLAAKLVANQDSAARSAILRGLARLYWREADWTGNWWGTRPDTSGPYYKTAEWSGTPKVKAALLAALSSEKGDVLRGLIVDLQRNKVNFPEAQALIAKAAKDDPTVKAGIVDTFAERATNPNADETALLREIALSDKEPAALRARAIRGLMRAEKNNAATDAAIDALATVVTVDKPAKELAAALEEFVREPKHASSVKQFEKLGKGDAPAKRELARKVLASIADSKLAKPDQKAAAAQALAAIGGVATAPPAPAPSAGGTLIETIAPEQVAAAVKKHPGDAAAGKELFTKQGCIACHTVAKDETPKGPFLGGIGARYSRDELIESIFQPNAKIAQGFDTQFFQTKDGDVLEGFVTREAGDEVELRNVTGVATVLKSDQIQKRGKRDFSIMPEGLVAKLTPGELASLVAYLESLKEQ